MPSGVIHSSADRGLSRSSLAASFSQSAGVIFGKSAIRNYVTQRGGFATPPLQRLSPPPSYGGGWEGEGTSRGVFRVRDHDVGIFDVTCEARPLPALPYDGGGKNEVIRWPGSYCAPRDRSGWPSACR